MWQTLPASVSLNCFQKFLIVFDFQQFVMCLNVISFLCILIEFHSASRISERISFLSFKNSQPFSLLLLHSLSFPCETPITCMLGPFHSVLQVCTYFSFPFFLFYLDSFHKSVFQSPSFVFCMSNMLLNAAIFQF